MAATKLLRNSVVLLLVVFVIGSAKADGLLSRIYKKAADKNRPVVLILDNSEVGYRGESDDRSESTEVGKRGQNALPYVYVQKQDQSPRDESSPEKSGRLRKQRYRSNRSRLDRYSNDKDSQNEREYRNMDRYNNDRGSRIDREYRNSRNRNRDRNVQYRNERGRLESSHHQAPHHHRHNKDREDEENRSDRNKYNRNQSRERYRPSEDKGERYRYNQEKDLKYRNKGTHENRDYHPRYEDRREDQEKRGHSHHERGRVQDRRDRDRQDQERRDRERERGDGVRGDHDYAQDREEEIQDQDRRDHDRSQVETRGGSAVKIPVIKSLLRTLNCDAKDECEDTCNDRYSGYKRDECEDKCETKYDCQEPEKNSCDVSDDMCRSQEATGSTRGELLVTMKPKCTRC